MNHLTTDYLIIGAGASWHGVCRHKTHPQPTKSNPAAIERRLILRHAAPAVVVLRRQFHLRTQLVRSKHCHTV
jgi:hypothetical protein